MLFGFLVSRAVLSISVIVFGANALRDVSPREWLKQKWWLLGLCWIAMYALSYFWSDDKSLWGKRLEVKLPILLLPLAFAFLPAFTLRQLKVFTVVGTGMFLAACGYSTSFIINNVDYYIYEYHMAHVLPTPAYNDHIRFSLAIALFVVWCGYFWRYIDNRGLRWFLAIAMVLLSAYLHLLAARTGLVVLYFFILSWSVYYALKKSKVLGLGIVVAVFTLAFFAFKYIPTLHNRVNYIFYTYDLYKKGEISGLYSDMGRMISYDVSGRLIKQSPLLGVGSGDMLGKMKDAYGQWYPQITDEQVLLPHNQFVVVMLAAGIVAFVLFVIWVIWPLKALRRTRAGYYFLVVWISLLLPLMIEPMLEVQFGVFVYLFFLLWQRHAFLHRPQLEA